MVANRHKKDITRIQCDRAIPQFDVGHTFEHEEKIICLVMLMLGVWPFEVGHPDVVVVVGCNHPWRVAVAESREFFSDIGVRFHGFSSRDSSYTS